MQKFLYLSCFLFFFSFLGNSQSVFINEVNYSAQNPLERGIEIVNLNETNLSGWKIYLYNSSGVPYDTIPLFSPSFFNPNQLESNIIIFVDVMMLSTNNGSGVVLTDDKETVVQYLTYCGGERLAHSGPAEGMTSTNIGCQDSENTPQLVGSGYDLSHFIWTTDNTKSSGDININQTFEAAPTTANVLPVEWLDFTATAQKTGILLTWATANEYDNDHFILERSQNGRTFEVAEYIKSKGDNTSEQHYQFLDTKANRGINYYRISQKDVNGKIDTYRIIEVQFENAGELNIYPNPAVNDIVIDLPITAETVQVDIFDRTGKLVLTQATSADNGLLNMQVDGLPSGHYILVVRTAEQLFNKTLIKQ